MNAAIHILLVEDNQTDVLLTENALSASHFHIQSSQHLGDALELLRVKHFDLILLDLGLPDSQGLNTLRTLRGKHPQVAVVVLTGKDDDEAALQALKEGAQDYLVKGQIQAASLQRVIRYAVERSGFEKMLRESEGRVKELTAHIHQVLWMIDAKESKILYVSVGYEKMWGRSYQSLIDNPHSYMECIHPLDKERMRRENAVMYESGHIDTECRILSSDGSERWVWIRGYPVREQGQIVRLVGVIEDITEKRRLAAEREALLSRLQLHIERMPLAYVLFDSDLRILDWNPAAERIFGYAKEEVLGKGPPYEQFVPRSFFQKGEEILSRMRAGDMQANSTNENLTKDGRKITCEWFNTPLMEVNGQFAGFICLAQDVTEQKSLEAQFHQAQKMEAVGQLAGGVAHDFNNLLTVINGYGAIVMGRLSAGDPARAMLLQVVAAGDRAAGLTRQLLAFSRKTIIEPKILDLKAVVADVDNMLRRIIGEDIQMTIVINPELGTVKADAGQIEQVILNLVVNARDAMPKGGRLTIEVRNALLDEMYAHDHPDTQAGPHVVLAVSDTGCGIDGPTMARIFEPFFTTKGEKGTGLGLATVHGIVKQSGGHVAAYSEVGHGSTFKVYLPRLEQRPASGKPQRLEVLPRGNETVLFVEDEDGVRALSRHVLQDSGYTVLEARDGVEAVRVAGQHQGRIDLLVTDVVMPRMGGREVAEQLATTRPGAKVLFLSGYTNDAVVRNGILEAQVAFLHKPFRPASLVMKVREVLDSKTEGNL